MRKFLVLLFVFGFIFSCSLNVAIDDLIVTNDLCDEMIEQFIVEEDPEYEPTDYGCVGYSKNEEDECLDKCEQQSDCDVEHYCNYTTLQCELRGVGVCTSDDYCRIGLCMCDVCLNLQEIVF